ncbi:MAG: apolipoprotein N-acyltransferase [Phycisphaerales bacterium]
MSEMASLPDNARGARLGGYPWWRHALAGLLFGAFSAAALPPFDVWPLAFAALVPLAWSAYHATRPAALGAVMVSIGTLPFWFFEERWLLNVTQPGYPLLCIYLSAWPGVFVLLVNWMTRRFSRGGLALPACLAVPIAWVALEFARGDILLTGYAWYLVSHPLIASSFLAAPAALLGAYFVSFLVAGLAGALSDATGWSPASRRVGGMAAGCIGIVWLGASWHVRSQRNELDPVGSIRFGVVQTNLPQDNKIGWKQSEREGDYERFLKLTREAAQFRPRADVICWPETMYPGTGLNTEYLSELRRLATERGIDPLALGDVAMAARLVEVQRELGIPLVVGAQALDGFRIVPASSAGAAATTQVEARYNSACVVDSEGIRAPRYDKMELTPFGEVIPYLWRWKAAQAWVEKVGAGGMKFDLSPGARAVCLPLDIAQGAVSPAREPEVDRDVRIVLMTPICFEATKAEHCRRLALAARQAYPDRARVMVNLSNDGWFGDAVGKREQHMDAARWRCVELGVPMVRAVNTGLSCFIDAAGRVHPRGGDNREVGAQTEGVVIDAVSLPPPGATTVFMRIGNMAGWVAVGGCVALMAGSVLASRRRKTR